MDGDFTRVREHPESYLNQHAVKGRETKGTGTLGAAVFKTYPSTTHFWEGDPVHAWFIT